MTITAQVKTEYLKCFIGKTPEQIKNYWSAFVSDECFMEGEAQGSYYFNILSFDCVNDGSNNGFSGHPAFVSYFPSESGKCYEHSMKVSVHNISIIKAQLTQAGYHYDSGKKAWINPNSKLAWTCEPAVVMPNGQTTDTYFIRCKSR
jgi:hypothetical protein